MKYRITSEFQMVPNKNIKVFRIEFLDEDYLGGWIESEANLSQEGYCAVLGNAMVYGNARVEGNAAVLGNAMVYGNSIVRGSANVSGNAVVCGNVVVQGNSIVTDNVALSDDREYTGVILTVDGLIG